MKKFILIAIPIVIAFFFSSCKKCIEDEPLVCESILKSVTVKIESSSSHSVSFDEIYTIRQSTGEKITNSRNTTPFNGMYVVLDDTYQPNLRNQADIFKLIGIKGGVKVFEEPFEIYADECHIGKRSGKDIIIIP